MTILTSWISPPAAVPCNALATIKISMLFDNAHMMELPPKIATATSNMSFRPHMSEILAQTGAPAALAKRYAPPIQRYPEAECRSDEMVGIAVATIVVSSAAMKSDSCAKG